MTTGSSPQFQPLSKRASFWRTMARGLVIVGVFCLVLIAGLWGYIYQAGGLKAYVERQLTAPQYALQTSIEKASLHFFQNGHMAQISFEGVALSLGTQVLHLPQAAINLSPAILLKGQLWQLELSQISLDLVQGDEGFSLGGEVADLFLAQENAKANTQVGTPDALAAFALLANRELRLSDSQITIRKNQSDHLVQFDQLSFNASFAEDGTLALTGQSVVKDANGSSVRFDVTSNLASSLTEVSLQTQALPLAEFAPFLTEDMRAIGGIGAVESQMMLLFDGTVLQTGEGQFTAREGQLPNGAKLDEVSAGLRYSKQDDYLILSDVKMALPEGQILSFSGDVAGLSQPQMLFAGRLELTDIPIDDLLSHWPDGALPDVRSYMLGSFSGGDFQRMRLDFKGQFARRSEILSLSALSFEGHVQNVRVQTSFAHISQFVGTANGKLALEVMAGGALSQASATLAIEDGYIVGAREAKALRFSSAKGDISYRPGSLTISDADLRFVDEGGLQADITLGVTQNRALSKAQIALLSERVSLDALEQLLPEDIHERLMPGLNMIEGGWVEEGNVKLSATFDEGALALQDISAAAKITQLEANLLEEQVSISDATAHLLVSDNKLSVDVTNASSDIFDLASARLDIAPLIARDGNPPAALRAAADISANLADLIPIMTKIQPQLLADLPLRFDEVEGTARLAADASATIGGDNPFVLSFDRLDGVISQASAQDFFNRHDVSQAELVVGYDGAQFDISGTMRVDDIQGEIAVTSNAEGLAITGQVPPQTHLASLVQTLTAQEVAGAIGGRFVVTTADRGETIKAVLHADMTDTALHIPLVNWAKLQGEEAHASGQFTFKSGALHQIEDLVVSAQDLTARGHVQMTDSGQFSAAFLENIYGAGYQIDEVIVEQKGDGQWHLIAQGPVVDLRPLLAADSVIADGDAARFALSFDITSEALVIDDDISLFGQMAGRLDDQGNGEAKLQGALLYQDEALLQEGTINAVFGASGEYLNAVGLIGGAEVRLEFSPDEAGGSLLIITTNNAGRVLSGLGVTDAIRAGKMVLVNQFPSDDFQNFNTVINIEEFNVIEAPSAVRAFSVLGLAGLYALVEGDGTRFTFGEAQIETTGKHHKIKKMVASGGAVGVSLVGEYHSDTRQVDVSGNLVPVNQFSKIIGAVPLLGDLLAGVDNAGIFATQFNLKGDIDDPETTVNAASLVPGLLRDIFSPDWLGRETDRLFGKSDNQSDTQ